MAEGFIVINRKITDWKWWKSSTAVQLWLYILFAANWKDGYDRSGNLIERGSFIRSLNTIAEDTNLSVSTVRRWLAKFQESGEIRIEKIGYYQKIIVVKYREYQDYEHEDEHNCEHNPEHNPEHGYNKNNNENKNNNTNNKHFTPPTVDEVSEYVTENYLSVNPTEFVDYYEQSGWRLSGGRGAVMKDWKPAARNWHNRRQRKEPKQDKWDGWAF